MGDIAVDMSNAEIIWAFTLTVNGKTLNTQCSGGAKVCKAPTTRHWPILMWTFS
jgi:hypothetical protein